MTNELHVLNTIAMLHYLCIGGVLAVSGTVCFVVLMILLFLIIVISSHSTVRMGLGRPKLRHLTIYNNIGGELLKSCLHCIYGF